MKVSQVVGAYSPVGRADIWRSCALGDPSSNPSLWTFPDPVTLSVPVYVHCPVKLKVKSWYSCER